MKKTIGILTLLIGLHFCGNAQVDTMNRTNPSKTDESEKTGDFRNKYQDTTREQKARTKKDNPNVTTDESEKTADFRNKYQDTTREKKAVVQRKNKKPATKPNKN